MISSSCPCRIRTHVTLRMSHIRIVLSAEGEARYKPSGDHAMRFILPVCPRKTWRKVRPGTGEPPISVNVVGSETDSVGLSSSSLIGVALLVALVFLFRLLPVAEKVG